MSFNERGLVSSEAIRDPLKHKKFIHASTLGRVKHNTAGITTLQSFFKPQRISIVSKIHFTLSTAEYNCALYHAVACVNGIH